MNVLETTTIEKIEISPYTTNDINEIVTIHSNAFKGSSGVLAGKNYLKAFMKWFIHKPDAITLKATFNGKLCGYVVGLPAGNESHLYRDLSKEMLLGLMTHPSVIFRNNFLSTVKGRIRRMMIQTNDIVKQDDEIKDNVPTDEKLIRLLIIAVDSRFNGKGIGKQIMEAFEEKAINMGMKSMYLTVKTTNYKARALYEREGWQEMYTKSGGMAYKKGLL